MPHVVTQACCGDASCVYACPVNCIHPTPDEPGFGTAEMLYIDPQTCVDCGACVSACPVGAISPAHRLGSGQERFADINAGHYQQDETSSEATRFPVDQRRMLPLAPIRPARALPTGMRVSVGIVGSGPSAMYAADELLRHRGVSVTIYERLHQPFGLARFGVAPDHVATRTVIRLFDEIARDDRVQIRLNTEIGRDLSLDDLRERHHAVIWAGGAPTDRRLDIDNADAQGVHSATSFVGWYNGHPDFASLTPQLGCDETVVVGNGNVALDVARILVTDPERLAETSIAPAALAALRTSRVRRVTVVGRRGPRHAAFTLPELVGLVDGGTPTVVDPLGAEELREAHEWGHLDTTTRSKLALLSELVDDDAPAEPHIRFAFHRRPTAIDVDESGRAVGICVTRPGPEPATEVLPAGLILTSIGYRGRAVAGLPFDHDRGVIPHRDGRVIDGDVPVPGMYVTGWIKRGPSGFIGTNKSDSAETVGSLLADLATAAPFAELRSKHDLREASLGRLGTDVPAQHRRRRPLGAAR